MFARAHRYQLIVDLVAVNVVLVLLIATRDPWVPLAGMAVLSAHAIVPLRFRHSGVEDERDAAHARTSAAAAFASGWVVISLGAVTLVMVHEDTQLVPSYFLVWMLLVAWLVQSIVGSSAALLLNRQD